MKSKLFRNVAQGIIVAVALLLVGGVAQADTYMNMYGTSEEANLWTGSSGLGMTLLTNLGCTSKKSYTTITDSNNTKSTLVVGGGCTGTDGGFIFLTYTNKASWDGIDAINGVFDTANWGTYNSTYTTLTPTANPCGAGNGDQRPVATAASCPGDATSCTGIAFSCQHIQVGVSNLEEAAIIQTTQGRLKGPMGGAYTCRGSQSQCNQTTATAAWPPYAGSSATAQQMLAYPFAIYVNPGVTSYRCSSASGTTYYNNFCIDDSNCGGTGGNHTLCIAQTIDNLSRQQIVALLSGQISNWDQFGVYYPSKPVTVCMRHAGAGTLSVLDLGVMQGSTDGKGWGWDMTTSENPVTSAAGPPYFYFNDLQSDETNCLAWADGKTFSGQDSLPSSVKSGAIGYVDADNADVSTSCANSPLNPGSWTNVGCYQRIKYNGWLPTRITMHDGIYDSFWTVDRMYYNTSGANALSPQQTTIMNQMISLAGNPTNLNSTTIPNQYLYYASPGELNFIRPGGNTFEYPLYQGCTNCASPDVVLKRKVK
ncbi:MAG TPA: hypothetical protein VEF34_13415 [Syntrophobacteraceae bacterium]|nr:hypothetical protein [Syntrophobacteraceae bacterium]